MTWKTFKTNVLKKSTLRETVEKLIFNNNSNISPPPYQKKRKLFRQYRSLVLMEYYSNQGQIPLFYYPTYSSQVVVFHYHSKDRYQFTLETGFIILIPNYFL